MKVENKIWSLTTLLRMADEIELNPSWQRGPVWSKESSSLLIDTILRGLDIPKIYLHVRGDAAATKYEAVDGQQRLRAIWSFGEDNLKLSLPKEIQPIDGISVNDLSLDDLPEELKKRFEQFKISVALVPHSNVNVVATLFSRLQMGATLNQAELRNAIPCPMRDCIDSIALTHSFFVNSKISSKRLAKQDFLAHALTGLFSGKDVKAIDIRRAYTSVSRKEIQEGMAPWYKVLDFLADVESKARNKIKQKWIFFDLFQILHSNLGTLDGWNSEQFASKYDTFQERRLKYNRKPESLLTGTASSDDKALYEYIQAFKLGAGTSNNIRKRLDSLNSLLKLEVK